MCPRQGRRPAPPSTKLIDPTCSCRQRARNCRKAQSCLGPPSRNMGRNIYYPSPAHSCKPGVRTCPAFSFGALWRFFQRSLSHPFYGLGWSSLGGTLECAAQSAPQLDYVFHSTRHVEDRVGFVIKFSASIAWMVGRMTNSTLQRSASPFTSFITG